MIFGILTYGNLRRKMLNVMESNSKGKKNFATELISTENVEGKSCNLKKCGRTKKKKSNLGRLV